MDPIFLQLILRQTTREEKQRYKKVLLVIDQVFKERFTVWDLIIFKINQPLIISTCV